MADSHRGNEDVKGTLFDIQRFAVHDGPGIRTLVFFKGCPLRCLWCDNPESLVMQPQLAFTVQDCIWCWKCREVCPVGAITETEQRVDREKCIVCGACASVCPSKALTIIGKEYSVGEVVAEVERDRPFYRRSGGGMTVSGGEPLMQPRFLAALLDACRQSNLPTAIETAGYASREVVEDIFPRADLVLFDLKHMDRHQHIQMVGVDPEPIHRNLKVAMGMGVPVIARVPVIPRHNDGEDNIRETARLAREAGIREMNLLPYHRLGENKYHRLGMSYPLEGVVPHSYEEIATLAGVAEEEGIKCTVGG